jgi:nitrate/nitrite-specific signal transduction histidine kinase
LTAGREQGRLLIKDDGSGIPAGASSSSGMGLHIMKYRSGEIGGALEIRRGEVRGTVVICNFPVKQIE